MPTVPPHSHREFRGVVEHTHPTSRSGVWRYSSNQTIADPGSGNLRWSADRLTLAMSKTTRDGVDAAHALAQVAVGDSIRVQVKTDATNAGWWEVTSVTDRGAWVEFGVTPTGGSPTAPANNTELMVTITYESSSVGVGNGGALTEADGDARYVNVTGDSMTGALTIAEGAQSNLYVKSASQRLWAMSRDSDLQSFLVSSDALNTAKRPLTIQATKVLLASGAESATDANAVVPKSYVDGKVDKAGDTMSGNLTISRAGTQAAIMLIGSSSGLGQYGTGSNEHSRNFYWDTIRRWKESQTPNTWAITRYDAAGANPVTALVIDNSDGRVTIPSNLTVSGAAVDFASGRIRYDSGTASFVLDDVSGVAGDRKGLILAGGNPTRADHAANKQYVDTVLPYGGKAARYSGTTATGYIIVEFDRAKLMSSMANITIKGFNYVSGQGEWEVTVGGYLYAGNPTAYWVNPSVRVIGHQRVSAVENVTLLATGGTAANDQRFAIAIGLASSAWTLPQVHVYVDAGYSALGGVSAVRDGASVSISTSLSGWTWTSVTNPNKYVIEEAAGNITNYTNWTDYGGSWTTSKVTKVGNLVTAQGMIKTTTTVNVTGGVGFTIGTIPVGYRPAETVMVNGFCTYSGGANMAVRVDMNTSGVIYGYVPTGGSFATGQWISYNGSWRV